MYIKRFRLGNIPLLVLSKNYLRFILNFFIIESILKRVWSYLKMCSEEIMGKAALRIKQEKGLILYVGDYRKTSNATAGKL